MVVADFDQTLSKLWYPLSMELMRAERLAVEPKRLHGRIKADAAMKVLFSCHKMTEEILLRTQQSFDHFRPIEIDETIPLEEKRAYMRQWWESNMVDFSSLGLND